MYFPFRLKSDLKRSIKWPVPQTWNLRQLLPESRDKSPLQSLFSRLSTGKRKNDERFETDSDKKQDLVQTYQSRVSWIVSGTINNYNFSLIYITSNLFQRNVLYLFMFCFILRRRGFKCQIIPEIWCFSINFYLVIHLSVFNE